MIGDTVYFTVKKRHTDTEKILQKVCTEFLEGKAVISILPTDTKSLSVGRYIYDIQISSASGYVVTAIKPSVFELTPEVTYE